MSGSEFLNDGRFVSVLNDPKFKKLSKRERKVKIDKRFQSMFKNDLFKVTYSVDKRGRKAPKTTVEDLKKYYDLSSDDESQTTENELTDSSVNPEVGDEDEITQSSDSSDSKLPRLNQSDDEVRRKQVTPAVRQKLKDMSIDYARGEGKLFTESSSDETESEESDREQIYHEWNELDKDADTTENITNRLAVCNMDWDRIKAVDLMILFNSFLPPNSLIRSVIIYPSEFGLKRLAEEEVYGPAELRNDEAIEKESHNKWDEEFDEDQQRQTENIRQYQLKRLKYYYAVATFDKPETADYIYTHCNSVEYESSGIRLDLRFIEDDITFDQEPKDICDSIDDCVKYNPCVFTNTALQQVKVQSTWDETDPRRTRFAEQITEVAKTKDIDDSELKDFVALSSSEEENENEIIFEDNIYSEEDHEKCERKLGSVQQYRKLLKEIKENEKQEKERNIELEITWGIDGVNSREKNSNKDDNQDSNTVKKKIKYTKKDKKKSSDDVMANESNDSKEKHKNLNTIKKEVVGQDIKQKKQLELLLDEEKEENKCHFSFKKIQQDQEKLKKKKFKKKIKSDKLDMDDFQVDVNDERFAALYSSHSFSLDPTNPKFLKTKGMNAFLLEKQKRITDKKMIKSDQQDEPLEKRKKDSDLSFLVKSVKSKTKSMLPNKFNKLR